METTKYFRIETLGCKVNQYDSQLIREQLLKNGYKECSGNDVPAGDGSLIVINTCTVTGKTDQKCRNTIRKMIKQKGSAKVVVTGCYVDGDRVAIEDIDGVDYIAENEYKTNILKYINKDKEYDGVSGITRFEGRTRAFLKIQDGCNEFCTYCKVPYVRGKVESKDVSAVVREAQAIINNGYKEIVLTGIHLGSYGAESDKNCSLIEVLKALSDIEGDFRIRLSSIEPMNITPSLIEQLSTIQKLCPHFHIPIQSGDDKILQKMGRHYTYSEYKEIIDCFKKYFPQCAISTDLIIGFPGETMEHFDHSVKAIGENLFSKVHVFPFSARKGTKACDYPDRVSPEEMQSREFILDFITNDTAFMFRRTQLGLVKQVLFEEECEEGVYSGFTENYQRVKVKGTSELLNTFASVKLTDYDVDCFYGELQQ
ncbi:MAG: tRNA (N(6)-L-threonylcarbamoyladenosine(37)-C(2))-methylthiotransferase MtaB [Candidatus Ancaeobacter aquaticus]|nr:tRNA (N(6)-L-threonylcarbamoyladenosine(37)-C(2))-methylthiotransferase MtaB [Candidatus Ancaeobacter aquaticus]